MANLIQATVYQIDGAPQQPSPITVDFRTREVVIKEASLPTIASVQSAILYYNVPNNPQSVQTFYVSEDIATLVGAANNAGTSQTQVTVLTINQDPQVPGGVQYSFPSNEILVGEFTDASIGVQAYVQYKNVKYYTQENEAAILAASNNTGVAAGTNPTSLFIPYNNGGIFGDSFLENDNAGDLLKTVWNTVDKGLKLDFLNEQYTLGRDSTEFLRVQTELIYTNYSGNDVGLKLDFANNVYSLGNSNIQSHTVESVGGAGNFYIYLPQIGDIQGLNVAFNDLNTGTLNSVSIGDILTVGNSTILTIDDVNQCWAMSPNLSANTAGASASKYLKVRVGGVDYKIALLNNA